MDDYPGRLHHQTPSWVESGSLFHVRVRVATEQKIQLIDSVLGYELLQAASRYHETGRWWCELFMLMPDHWHGLMVFPSEPGMSSVMRDWKRGTTRFERVRWQDNFFDHRIRNAAERAEKWHYIRRNPVVKGLCQDEEAWPWWWSGGLNQGGTH